MKRQYVVLLSAALLGLASCGTTPSSSVASSQAGDSSKPSDSSVASSGTSSKTSSAGTSSAATTSKPSSSAETSSAGTTSAGTSSAGTTSAGTSSQGGTSSAGTSQGTSSTVTPTGTKKIYFEDQPWWNAYADYPMALLTGIDGTTVNTPSDAPKDSAGATIPGVKMTAVGTHTISTGKVNNFWSIDVDLSVYSTIQFLRYGYEEAKSIYWAGNAKTDSLTISALGENDLYVLTETETYFDAKGAAATTISKFDSSMYVTVTLNLNYDGAPEATTQQVEKGKAMSKPAATRANYTLAGWYTEAACTNAFDFATLITADLTLYAKWTEGAPTSIWANLPSVDHIVVFAPVSMKYTYVYYWNKGDADHNAAWPGVKMTVWSGSADWYIVDMTGFTVGKIIFNSGSGGTQTADLSLPESGYHWYVNDAITTTAPAA